MRSQIEAAFRPLLGQPLTDMWRYAGCQKFEFGVQLPARNRKGEEITRADIGLVVSCEWHIMGPAGRVVSSLDFGPDEHRKDSRAKPFYNLLHTAPPKVEAIEADDNGMLRIRLSQRYELQVLPEPESDPQAEQWRLMLETSEQNHVVLCGDHLETLTVHGKAR